MSPPIGPVILDLKEPELSTEEREILQHPSVGGIILFTRNYENPKQLTQLCKQVRKSRPIPLLISVDQEGGRVQRFRDGFSLLPPMGQIGALYEKSPHEAKALAEKTGAIMASELLAVGIDLSFAPVLDLNKELNTVIGDRAFHQQPNIVIDLAKSLMRGMRKVGMAITGKHFPGHGSVLLDSHLELPLDEREFKQIAAEDLIPFAKLIEEGMDAVMSAHILFPAVDDKPVSFSSRWLKDILRQQLKFTGLVFSDDLNMKGADSTGDYAKRAQIALQAGCDMVLICNNRVGAISILDHLPRDFSVSFDKFKKLQGVVT